MVAGTTTTPEKPSSSCVADASAILAHILQEKGWEVVDQALENGLAMSAINLTEVYDRLVGGALPEDRVQERLLELTETLDVVPFDAQLALEAGYLYARRRPYNLSLGDCACLALAESLDLPVLTAETNWAKLPNLRVRVKLIR